MLPRQIHQFIFDKLKLQLVGFVVLIILFVLSMNFYKSSLQSRYIYDKLSKEATEKLNILSEKEAKFTTDLKIWNDGLYILYKERNGLQVDIARKKIEALKAKYNVRAMTVSFTTPEKRTNFRGIDNIDLKYSFVSIYFETFTDADALKFVNALKSEIPGTINYTSLTMTGVQSIDGKILDLSNPDNPKLKEIVNVKLELLWQDFQDISESEVKS